MALTEAAARFSLICKKCGAHLASPTMEHEGKTFYCPYCGSKVVGGLK